MPRALIRALAVIALAVIALAVIALAVVDPVHAAGPRARDLGIPFTGDPGPHNAITDVPGLEVGYTTLIRGEPGAADGAAVVRTGVTVILPRGKTAGTYAAAWFSLNGDGELTGIPHVQDHGMGYGPIGITNTNSVGVVRDAIGAWCLRRFGDGTWHDFSFGLPIVGETWDGMLNDITGLHVTAAHVRQALDGATGGPVAEGNVGGGTGMALYGFKGGSGTASRVFTVGERQYTLGVFVQANFGGRSELMIAGVPVGREITDLRPEIHAGERQDGSLIAIVATDAPLLPGQLSLIARRVTHGLARTGTYSHQGSGEIFLALSTATPEPAADDAALEIWRALPKRRLDPVFAATVHATEEAIINVLVAAETMTGRGGNTLHALPHDRLREVMSRYGR